MSSLKNNKTCQLLEQYITNKLVSLFSRREPHKHHTNMMYYTNLHTNNGKDENMSNITAQSLKSMDIETIDPLGLTDIRTVDIDTNLPRNERVKDYIRQMGGNPYFCTHGTYVVKMSYSDTTQTINDALEIDWKRYKQRNRK